MLFVNLFLTNIAILYRLKTPENQTFPFVFRVCKMGTLVDVLTLVNELIIIKGNIIKFLRA